MALISTFNTTDLTGNIHLDKLQYIVSGKFRTPGKYLINFSAAAPGDLRLSYSGSGLPFVSPQQAYFDTPNKGKLETSDNGVFSFKLWAPNSYYINQGTTLVRPHVHMCIQNAHQSNPRSYDLKLGPGIPNRSLRHLDGKPDRSYDR